MVSDRMSIGLEPDDFFEAVDSNAFHMASDPDADMERGNFNGRSVDVVNTADANNRGYIKLAMVMGCIAATTCIAAFAGLIFQNITPSDTSSSANPYPTMPANPIWDGTVCAYEPPSGVTFSALQDRINALNWDVNATAACAYPFIQEHADHCGTTLEGIPPQMRAAPEAYIAQLKLAADQFNTWQVGQNSTDYAVVLDKNDPNALGVFEQALPLLTKLPKYVLPYELGLAGNEVRNVAAFHKEHPEIKTFATFNFVGSDPVKSCMVGKRTVSALGELEIPDMCLADEDYWPTPEDGSIEQCNYEYFDAKRNYTLAYIVPNMPDPTCVLPSSRYSADGAVWSNAHDHIHIFTSKFNQCNGVTING